MRILSLDLDRYGPFTGRRLVFRPGAQLHVVYGRNEAGKSSSLAAVTDLLFGIERRTAWDFVHAGKDMQLSAEIVDRRGATLAFRRRKTRPVLSRPDGAPLPDDALAPFLGGVSREVFRRAFGLDAEALRRSALELQSSDGELGAALLSAGQGLRGIAALSGRLEEEADAIFAPRAGKDRRFFQALKRYDEARSALRETETRSGALKALQDEIAGYDAAIAEASGRRQAIAVEKSRLDRLRRAAPVIAAIDDLAGRLASHASLSGVPEGLGSRLSRALEGLQAARGTRDQMAQRVQKLARDKDALDIDTAVLDLAAEIERLAEEAGAYLKSLQDLPRVQAEADGATVGLEQVATRLGLPDIDTLIARRPDDAAQARVTALIAEGVTIEARARSAAEALQRDTDELAARRREREERGVLADPAPMRERLAALRPALRRAVQVLEDEPALQSDEAALASRAARLVPPVGDLGALAGVPLPARETVARHAARLAELDQAERREAGLLDAAQAGMAEARVVIASVAAGRPVPTPEAIGAARAARGEAWRGLRSQLFGEAPASAPSALAASVSAFEAGIAEADALADAAVSDAARVEAHAGATRRLAEQDRLAREAGERLAAARETLTSAWAEWSTLWQPAGVAPLPPAEMSAWLDRLGDLLERRDALLRRRAAIEAARGELAGLVPHLERLAHELGLSALPGLAADPLADRIETEIGRLAARWDGARELDGVIGGLVHRAKASADADEAARGERDRWRDAFAVALPSIGLPATAGREEAHAALKAWADLPGLLDKRNDLLRRVAGIRRDVGTFEAAVDGLRTTLRWTERGEPADVSVRRIGQRLVTAREAKARRQKIDEDLADAAGQLDKAEAALAEAGRAAAALAASAGCDDPVLFPDIASGLVDRDTVLQSLQARRAELANAADGRDEKTLREALAAHDPDLADATLAGLAREEELLDAAVRQAVADRTIAEQKLASIQGSVGAEIALLQRRGAEAEMVEAARDWAVVKLASVMVGAAVERSRAAQHAPMLARTGVLFSTLTGGAYRGVAQTHDEDDTPHLAGVRAGGGEVAFTAMSEGTRDQLCLALRLAWLEDFASRAEPAPFVGDDLFSSFDEERTAQGLAALAAIGGTVQPILFTHHRFVADAALRELGDAADVVEL